MKQLLGIILCCTLFVPMHAQYLLEEPEKQNNNSQYLLEQSEGRKHKTEKDNLFSKSLETDSDHEIAQGYRGFGDFGLGFSSNYSDFSFISFSTTHGYQIIDNYFFIGGGLSLCYSYNDCTFWLPIFLDIRSDFLQFNKWSIFANIKAGYSVCGYQGLYSDPQFGVRYGLTDKLGINLGLGYGLQYDQYWGDIYGFLSIKIGVDF